MLNINILASGSKGNAYIIDDNGDQILIDPGIQFKEIQKRSGYNLANLSAVLVSHEHKDHCMGIDGFIKLGNDIFMSKGTYKAIGKEIVNLHVVMSRKQVSFNNWLLLPFNTEHDAEEPLGFLIKSPSGKKIFYATDTYYIKYAFTEVTHYMVECNYSRKMMEENYDLHPSVKARIVESHFELENVKQFFRSQDLTKTERIYLLHLSESNADPYLFTEEIEKLTGLPVYTS